MKLYKVKKADEEAAAALKKAQVAVEDSKLAGKKRPASKSSDKDKKKGKAAPVQSVQAPEPA